MKRVLLTILLTLLVPAMGVAADNQSINIFVTPVVTVSLSADVTSYNFGNMEVNTSSVTASEIVLTNDGNVGITIEKTVWSDDGWDVTLSSTSVDGFDLWAMTKSTNSTRPLPAHFTLGNDHNFNETDLQEFNNLSDSAGDQADLDPNGQSDIWFKIDMPKKVSTSGQQIIHIRLKATGKNSALMDGTWQDIEFYTDQIMELLEKERQKALRKGSKSYDDARVIGNDYMDIEASAMQEGSINKERKEINEKEVVKSSKSSVIYLAGRSRERLAPDFESSGVNTFVIRPAQQKTDDYERKEKGKDRSKTKRS